MIKASYLGVLSKAKVLALSTVALSLCLTAADVGMRWCSGSLIDALNAGTLGDFPWGVLAALALLLIGLHFLLPYSRTRLANQIQAGLYAQLEKKALCGEQKALNRIAPGEAGTFFTADVTEIVRSINRMVGVGLPDLFSFVLSVAVLCAMNPWLGIAAVAASLLPVVFMFFMSKALVRVGEKYQGVLERINQNIANHFFNLELIKASTLEDASDLENRTLLKELLGVKRRQSGWEAVLSFPTMFSSFLTILFLAVLGGYFVQDGSMQPGELFTAITLANFVVDPVMRFDGTIAQIRRAKVSFQRINQFLTLADEGSAMDCFAVLSGREKAALKIDGLEFSYEENGKKVFDGGHFRWEEGSLHILVGENGTGKSTLLKLLSGIYLPRKGAITLSLPGDRHPRKLTRQEVREQLIIDPQQPLLFPGTIRQNLCRGRELSMDAIGAACRAAGIDAEIEALPGGYDTVLGPEGTPLSGGQKRRLCLARSLLREGNVFLFDEPTTGVDPRHIQELIGTLRALAEEKLVIVITHEPLLIQAADTVTRLEASQ